MIATGNGGPGTDPRTCPADGADHDWQNRNTIHMCARPISRSVYIATGTCTKCGTHRTVTHGPGQTVEVVDTPASS